MEDVTFWRLLLAVMAGNMLTVVGLYCFYKVNQADQEGEPGKIIFYLGFLFPLAMAGLAFYLQK